MSIASDINARKTRLQTILEDSNSVITAKGGKDATDLSGLPDAIYSIPAGASGNLQEVTITPTGQEIVTLPQEGYGGFSKVTVSGDANLVSANIRDGVTIYGVLGTARGGGADEKNLPIPSDYQSYVTDAKALYTGDYSGLMILDSGANTVAVCFFMDDFSIKSYDASTTAFSMIGAYYCKYAKDTQTWEQLDYRTSVSAGEHYGKHIKFATRILFYGTTQVWPSGSGGNLKEVTVTPTGQQFTVTPESGYDGFSKVNVAGDANLVAANIKEGVTVYGVTGTASGGYPEFLGGSVETGYFASSDYFTDKNAAKYNGVTLPIVPMDMSEYKYAFICKHNTTGKLFAVVSTVKYEYFTANNSLPNCLWSTTTPAVRNYNLTQDELDSGLMWRFREQFNTAYYWEIDIISLIWSNYDILKNSDGSIYFEAGAVEYNF